MMWLRTRIGIVLGVAAIALALGTTYGSAQDRNTAGPPPPFMGRGGPGGPGRGGPMGLPMLRGIELTETQRTEVRSLVEAAEADFVARREKLHGDVMNLLTDEQKAQIAERPAPPERAGRGFGGRGRPQGPAH